MGDHRASIKINAELHGVKKSCDMWINYTPGVCDGVDDRIVEFFRVLYKRGMAKYEEINTKPVRANNSIQQQKKKYCVWHHNDEAWSTECGQYFVLNEGSPYQNGMHFCYHCGRVLRVKRLT